MRIFTQFVYCLSTKKIVFTILHAVLLFWAVRGNATGTLRVQPTTSNGTASGSIEVYRKVEVAFDLNETFTNPYDPDQINITVIFTPPAGANYPAGTTFPRPAFYYADYNRATDGSIAPVVTNRPWRARFAPPVSGNWTYSISVASQTTAIIGSGNFSCVSSNEKGFIKNDAINRKFVFGKDNSLFFPIGLNMELTKPYSGTNFYPGSASFCKYYLEEINKSADWGGNFFRLWMRPSQIEIEWGRGQGQPGNYSQRQAQAYELDNILDESAKRDTYIQLCMATANSFLDAEWVNNPYNLDGTNSEANKMKFFTDANCKIRFKRKIRYIVARWGYSTHLLSYELFNEADMCGVQYWSNNRFDIRDWHAEMIAFITSLSTRNDAHLITTSVAFANSGENVDSSVNGSPRGLFDLPGIDYVQHHYYTRDYNGEFQLSYLAQSAAAQFPTKSYLLGEFGFAIDPASGSSYMPNDQKRYNDLLIPPIYVGHQDFIYDLNEMHNTLWSTTFSGAAGAGLYWWTGHLFESYGGQYKYFKPLSTFVEANKIYFQNSKPISNTYINTYGPNDDPYRPQGYSTNSGEPIYMSSYPPQYHLNGITTSDDANIEVFALKSPNAVIGWVHSKYYYWSNLPHFTNYQNSTTAPSSTVHFIPSPYYNPVIPYVDSTHPANPTNSPTYFQDFPVLDNKSLTVQGIHCPGIYKVEFWGTFPSWGDSDSDLIEDNGGIIKQPSFIGAGNGTSVGSNNGTFYVSPNSNGELQIPIPKLAPIGNKGNGFDYEPYAPDYAFRILYVGGWQHDWLTHYPTAPETVASDIAASSSDGHVFFRGTDGRLHQYYFNSAGPTWIHDLVPPASSTQTGPTANDYIAQNSSITAGALGVLYKGADGYVHRYYFDQGINDWKHERLTTNPSPPSGEKVAGSITSGGGKVFFRGADNKVHQYYRNGNSWEHGWITQWNSPSAENVAGSVAASPDGHIFFRGTDGKLHQYYYGSNGWTHDWVPPSTWNVPASATDDIAPTSSIVPANDADNSIFYQGTNGYIHRYFYNLSINNWQHEQLNINATNVEKVAGSITSDGGKVFFRGADNKVHQYYRNGNSWEHGWITQWNSPSAENVAGSVAASPDGHIFFRGTDDKVHQYFYSNVCYQNRSSATVGTNSVPSVLSNSSQLSSNQDLVTLSAFPNPTDDFVTIQVNGALGSCNLVITDVLGKTVYSTSLQGKKTFELHLRVGSQKVLFTRLIRDGKTLKAIKVLGK